MSQSLLAKKKFMKVVETLFTMKSYNDNSI